MIILSKPDQIRGVECGARRLPIHPLDFSLDGAGIKEFFDPVPREALKAFREAVLPRTAAFGRALERREDRDLVACCTGHFALFVMQCLRAARLIERCDTAGIEITARDQDFLTNFLSHDPGRVDRQVGRLVNGHKPRPWWRMPARMMRNALTSNPIVRREVRTVDLDEEIVTIAISSHLEKHATAVDDTVVYVHPSFWYPKLELQHRPGLSNISAGLLEVARQAYAAVNVRFDSCSEWMIRYWVDRYPAIIQTRLMDLQRQRLPKRLWIGSAGSLWSRMMGHAVRAAGGHVTGHDHWTSVGYFNTNVKAINDYECVDEFLALTDAQAQGLARTCRYDILVRSDRPRFGVIPGKRWRASPVADKSVKTGSGKTVMLVINHFNGSGVAIYPDDSDYALVDWHARLITWLQANGYEVILKPHPQCEYGVPDGLRALVHGRVLLEPFSKVCKQADLLIYDFPMSTTFGEGLEGDQAMVLISFEPDLYRPEALDLLQRRCAVVQGFKGEDGRRQVDWALLLAALKAAPSLADTSFFDTYLTY